LICVRVVLLIDEEEEEEENTNTDGIFFLSFLFFFSLADVEEKSYRAEHSLMSFVNSLSVSLAFFYPFFSFYLALPFLLIERRVLIRFRKK
jgi:hypothetical protein